MYEIIKQTYGIRIANSIRKSMLLDVTAGSFTVNGNNYLWALSLSELVVTPKEN